MRHYLKHDMNNKYIFYFWLKNCTLLELFHAPFSMAWHRAVCYSVPWFRVLSHDDYIYCIAANAITWRTCSRCFYVCKCVCVCVCMFGTSMYVDGNGDNQLNKDVNNNLMKNNFSEFSDILCLSRDFLQYRQIYVDFSLARFALVHVRSLTYHQHCILHGTEQRPQSETLMWIIYYNIWWFLSFSSSPTLIHSISPSFLSLFFVHHNRSRWSKWLA